MPSGGENKLVITCRGKLLKLRNPEKFIIIMEYLSITCNSTMGNLRLFIKNLPMVAERAQLSATNQFDNTCATTDVNTHT